MDHLSNLPKHILDNILSRLPEEDVAKASILSKAWNHTCFSCPILRFSHDKYVNGVSKDRFQPTEILPPMDLERKRNSFAQHVEKTLTRFHDQGLAIREFKLFMEYSDSQSMYHQIDHWLRLVVEGGVQMLDLTLRPDIGPLSKGVIDRCCLPPSILEAKSLINLSLSFGKIDHVWVDKPIQFSLLQKLSLSFVVMRNEQIIQNIISSCPLIEHLSLISCYLEGPMHKFALKFIRIHGLRKLKSVTAKKIQEIDIDAPSLEYLGFSPAHNVPFKINLDKCKNLKELYMSYLSVTITDQWFLELFLKFPLLERLELRHCSFSKKIKVSSNHLKVLVLTDQFDPNSNLKEVINIDAPNLCCFKYVALYEMPTWAFMNSSSQLQVDLTLFVQSYWDFQKLRQFLQSFEHRNIIASLSLWIQIPNNEFDSEVLRDVSVPPPSIKHLKLYVYPKFHSYFVHIVTVLLCSCRPTTISLRRDSGISDSLLEAFCHVLNSRKHDDCYCRSRDIKYWWHDLKGVQVTSAVEGYFDMITFQSEY